MCKKQCVAIALLLLATLCGGCSELPPRSHHEPAGGFSFDPPKGWVFKPVAGAKYECAFGTPSSDVAPTVSFDPTIYVADEAFIGSLKDYVAKYLENMPKLFTDPKVLKQEDLTTDDGEPMVRLLIRTKLFSYQLRRTFYFYSRGSTKCVMTCSALDADGGALDSAFAAAAKSFRTHRKE